MKNEGRVDISFLMSSIKRYEDFGINFVSSICLKFLIIRFTIL